MINMHYTIDLGRGNEMSLICHLSGGMEQKRRMMPVIEAMMKPEYDISIRGDDINNIDMICENSNEKKSSCHLMGRGAIDYNSENFNDVIVAMKAEFGSCLGLDDRSWYGDVGCYTPRVDAAWNYFG